MSEDVMPRNLPGLISYRGKSGFVYWYTSTAIGGRPSNGGKRIYVRHGVLSRDEAEKRHKEIMENEWRRLNGIGPPSDVVEKIAVGITFDEATRLWLLALESAGRDTKTIKSYRNYLRWSSSFIGSNEIASVSVEDAQRLRVSLKNGMGADGKPLEKPLAFRTRRNVETIASMLFHYATDPARRWAEHNPFASLVSEKAPKKSQKKGAAFRRLHPREDEALLSACESDWFRCATAIGLYLGVRSNSVACLRIEDVDQFNKVICVPCEFNKGINSGVRQDQWLPVPRHLLPHLKSQVANSVKKGSPWLFPTGVTSGKLAKSGHIIPQNFIKNLKKSAAKIGYPDGVNFHALRAICNNRLRASGINSALYEAAHGTRAILGHASEESARPYLDATIEYLRPVIERYDEWLDEVTVGGEKVMRMSG